MVNSISDISTPSKVRANFRKYKGNDDVKLELSEKKDKKYKVIVDGKTVHFGSTMEDYTKHKDESRRKSYLARAKGIKGDWKSNKYSPNNLAINLLWN
jgi:uncharacterized membrane protein YvbJ